jgi:hypothetical protein
MQGNIIYSDVLCIEDIETKHQYPLNDTSINILNCCNKNHKKKHKKAVKSATYITHNNEAVILNIII